MRFALGAARVLATLAAFSCLPTFAAESNGGAPAATASFDDLFTPLHEGGCVKIEAVRAIGATVTLTAEQFQFVRAFWMAIPPVSHELPLGSRAFLAKDGDGKTVLGLFDDDGEVCAVFEATDWIQRLIDQVGRGETGKRGEGL